MGAEPASALVGRDAESAQVRAFVGAPERFPRVLVCEGEAGIGKTTLWMAGVEGARRRGLRVLVGRASPVETRVAFAAMGSLIESAVHHSLSRLPPAQQRALRIALFLEEPDGPPPAQRTTFAAIARVLRHLTEERPAVVAIDDVQFLDPSSVAGLSFAGHHLDGAPIGFLLTRRNVGGEGKAGLVETLSAGIGGSRVEHVEVGPLSLAELYQVLHQHLDLRPSRPLLRRILRVSGGNPLLALEIARVLRERHHDVSPTDQLPVPTDLRELLAARLHGLPPRTKDLLLVAASTAEPTIEVLERAIGSDLGGCLDPALEADILIHEGDRVRFTHPLLSSTVSINASPWDRRVAHRRLADAVPRPEEQARHLALASAAPDPEVAAALDQASAGAAARGLSGEAAELSEMAVRLTPVDRPEERARRQVEAGEHHFYAGDHDRASSLLSGLLTTEAPGSVRARAAYALAQIRVHEARLDAGVRSLAAAAIDAEGDPLVRSLLELELAGICYQSGDVASGERHARIGLKRARGTASDEMVAYALVVVAWMGFLRGQGLDLGSLQRARRLLRSEITRVLPYPTWIGMQPEFIEACLRKWGDDLPRARQIFEELRRRDPEQRDDPTVGPIHFQLGELELWAGNWDRADRCARACREAGFRSSKHSEFLFLTLEAWSAALRGDVEGARELAERALVITEAAANVPFIIRNLTILGFCEVSIGDPFAAYPHYERAISLLRDGGFIDPGPFRFQADAIESSVAVGAAKQAREVIALMDRLGRELDRPWPLIAASRGRAAIAVAAGDHAGAVQALEVALAQHDRIEMPFERGRTMLALGVALRRARRKRLARDALSGAHDAFHALGAPTWRERAQQELDLIGGRRSSRFELTPAERRVAELVARGLTNRRIADELALSVHTVESHLSRIYVKLGIRSRAELAHQLLTETG
jgi:DNA-binding CsgD family transcriptional regulator/tetratricopeptide (TPR) repeat protein